MMKWYKTIFERTIAYIWILSKFSDILTLLPVQSNFLYYVTGEALLETFQTLHPSPFCIYYYSVIHYAQFQIITYFKHLTVKHLHLHGKKYFL